MARKKKRKKRARAGQAGPTAPGPMSYADAAEHLLRQERKPLKYRFLTKTAIDDGLIHTESKTPHITMYVSLRADIQRRQQRGEPQRFIFLGKGLFTLVELVTAGTERKTRDAVEQVRESRKDACKALHSKLTAVNRGPEFETMVSDLLMALGYQNVEPIGGKDDQGVDIVCEKRDGITTIRVAIQCKCKSLSSRIGPKDISTLRDNLSTYQCQQGILVTTSRLNDDAIRKAKEPGKEPIHYIEHDEILDLLAQHGIGIRSESVTYFQLDSSQYDFLK